MCQFSSTLLKKLKKLPTIRSIVSEQILKLFVYLFTLSLSLKKRNVKLHVQKIVSVQKFYSEMMCESSLKRYQDSLKH